jgi:uncharacterized protein YbaR (Trm112 family)
MEFPMSLDFDALRDMLVCPKSHSKLVMDGQWLVSVDPECRLRYEIRDGIPIMLIDEAVELAPEEWSAIMQKHGRDPQTGQELDTPDTEQHES